MLKGPPRKLRITEVPRFIRITYGQNVRRETIYNWIRKGRGGVKLRTMPGYVHRPEGGRKGKNIIMSNWVEEFIAATKGWV